MSDFRALILKSAAASAQELAPVRSTDLSKLVADIRRVLATSKNTPNQEYETTCALRLLSRCIVATDDASGRDPDATSARDDIKTALTSATSATDAALSSLGEAAALFCENVCQTAVGLVAIDGIYRLVNVYGDDLCSHLQNKRINDQDPKKSTTSTLHFLEEIVGTLFLELNVQELPTMSRRNAVKVLRWYTAKAEAWACAIGCIKKRMEEANGDDDNNDNNSAASKTNAAEDDVHATAAWISTISECLGDERDPVNVKELFEITINVHDGFLLQSPAFTAALGRNVLLAMSSSSASTVQQQQPPQQEQQRCVSELAEAMEALFQVSAGYFPLQFSPAPGAAVKKETLVEKLHLVLSCPLFTSFTLLLVLHKLESAASTTTILNCLDVLQGCVERWTAMSASAAPSSSSSSPTGFFDKETIRFTARRFLKDLLPVFTKFIKSQASASAHSSNTSAVAGRIVSVMSAAAAAYDSTWPHGVTFSQSSSSSASSICDADDDSRQLSNCDTLRTFITTLPSAQSDPTSVLLDASLIHAVGRQSPLLAMVLAASVLPVIAADRVRMPVVAALLANLEMNSAPSSAGATSPSNNYNRGSLDDPNAPESDALRNRVTLDAASHKTLAASFEVAVGVAEAVLVASASTSSSRHVPDEQHVRAAADIAASASCVVQRKILQIKSDDDSASSAAPFVDRAIQALVRAWKAQVLLAGNINNQELVDVLGNAVSVGLVTSPSSCGAEFSSSPIIVVGTATASQDGASATAAAATTTTTTAGNLRRAVRALRAVIGGSISKSPTSSPGTKTALRLLLDQVLAVRLEAAVLSSSAAHEQEENDTTSSSSSSLLQLVDDLCLAPLMAVFTSIVGGGMLMSALAGHVQDLEVKHDSKKRNDSSRCATDGVITATASVIDLLFQLSKKMTPSGDDNDGEIAQQQLRANNDAPVPLVVTPLFRSFCDALLAGHRTTSTNFEPSNLASLLSEVIKSASTSKMSSNSDFLRSAVAVGRIAATFLSAIIAADEQEDRQQERVCEVAAELKSPDDADSEAFMRAVVSCNMLRLASFSTCDDDTNENNDKNSKLPVSQVLAALDAVKRGTDAGVCIKEVLRPALLLDTTMQRKNTRNTHWQETAATELLTALLLQSGSKDADQRRRILHNCTSLVRSAEINSSTASSGGGVFDAIVSLRFEAVLELIDFSAKGDDKQQTRDMYDATYQSDCLSWLEWLLRKAAANQQSDAASDGGSEQSKADAAARKKAEEERAQQRRIKTVQHLLHSGGGGDSVLLQLCDMATAPNATLPQRERPLKILGEVGRTCLQLSMDKHATAGAIEAAVKPLVPQLIKRSQPCLRDPKRIVRAATAELRHVWLLLPK